MKVENFGKRRLFLAANEAGGGSLLAALVSEWQPAIGSMGVVSATAAPYFLNGPLPVRQSSGTFEVGEAIALIELTQPDWVVVGASAFTSVEKTVMQAALIAGRPVAAFVDHYWNLWQRFAHEETAERWFYKPDVIFLPSQSCVERIVQQGAPHDRIHVFTHPLLQQAESGRSQISAEQIRRTFNLPKSGAVVLFVSEYGFPESSKWQWEQAPCSDLFELLDTVLEACCSVNDSGQDVRTALIKLHPAQAKFTHNVLARYPETAYRLVTQCDKKELFQASDLAIGLDSMLLLEACRAGVPAYSYHPSGIGKGHWLSDIHPEISELSNKNQCTRVIQNISFDTCG